MLKNMMNVTMRNLMRNKQFTLLNITGLSVGIASFLLIIQFILWDLSFDQFHDRANDIYRVTFKYFRGDELGLHSAANFGKVGPQLIEDFPEIETSCRIVFKDDAMARIGDQIFEEKDLYYAEQSLLDVFNFEILKGNPTTCLQELNSIIISEESAERLFGKDNPIGQSIQLTSYLGQENYVVTAVVKSAQNSHFRFNMIASFGTYLSQQDIDINSNWNRYDCFTYVKLVEGASQEHVLSKMPQFIDKHGRERLKSDHVRFELQPITDIHLKSDLPYELSDNGNERLIDFLMVVSIFIILIAWINYVNLSTASFSNRTKEIGVRKTLGSSKSAIRFQFLIESSIINGLAVCMGLIIFLYVLPFMSGFVGRVVENTFTDQISFWFLLIGFWILGSVLSGFYPSLILSRMDLVDQVNNRSGAHTKWSFRNVLIVFQFAISAILICGATVIVTQLKFMTNRDLGIDIENKIGFYIPNYLGTGRVFWQQLRHYKNDLKNLAGVENVAISSEIPGEPVLWSGGSRLIKGSDENIEYTVMRKMTVDQDYMKMFDNQLVTGRMFSSSGDSVYAILNETGIKTLGISDPELALNQRLYLSGFDTVRILGIIKDFHQESLANPIRPTAYLLSDFSRRYVSIEISDNFNLDEAKAIYRTHFVDTPITVKGVNEHIDSKYSMEKNLLDIIIIFSSLAIFIAMLGLIGLVFYFIEKRKKEISIRRVLGSKLSALYGLLTKQIISQAILANVLVTPIIFVVAEDWLDNFAFRSEFPWWSILTSAVVTIFIALMGVSHLIISTIKKNPVINLRSE